MMTEFQCSPSRILKFYPQTLKNVSKLRNLSKIRIQKSQLNPTFTNQFYFSYPIRFFGV